MMLAGLLVAVTIALGFFLANLGILQVGSYMRVFSTRGTMSRVDDALIRYAAVRQRLPCPANPALDSSNAAAGFADGDVTDSTAPTTCTFPGGVVPWRSLGLSASDALDPWGRLISYRVYDGNLGLTRANGASRIDCDTDNNGVVAETAPVNGLCASDKNTLKASFIQHASYSGVTKGVLVKDFGTTVSAVAYALISHGPTGLGGYISSGARLTMPGATATDYANTQAAATGYIKAAYSAAGVSPGAAGFFDDIVAYKTIDDLISLARLDARDWPEKLPTFSVATTTNMTAPSTDPENPHFMSTGTAIALTAFTAQQVSFGGAPAETVLYQGAALPGASFSSCLWWPLKLTLFDSASPRDLRIYTEFAAVDNPSDAFAGFTLGFLAGNDLLGAPTNSTCGTSDFSTSATGTAGLFTITVADPTNIVVGLNVTGAGIGTGVTGAVATVTAVAGNTVTLSFANSADVNGLVDFANSRLIRRDLGWAGGTVASYSNRFAIEFDGSRDATTFLAPPVPTANDPARPHLAIDGDGVTHGTDAESCSTTSYGDPCNDPIATFPFFATTADQVAGASTISVASISGIVTGMPVFGVGIGAGATVVNIIGTTVSLGTGGAASTPVLNTATMSGNPVAFAALSAANFMQNGLDVFHSVRADISAKSCVSKAGTTGVAGTNVISVPSSTQIAPGMLVYGENTPFGATVTSVVGTTITLSSANSGTVNERVDFALPLPTTKAATGFIGSAFLTVADNHGIAVDMAAAGTGIASGAMVTNVAGTTVTLSAVNSGAVSGAVTFTPPNQARSATITAGQNNIIVGDATGIVVGMEVSGFGIASGATVTSTSGTTLTLSLPSTFSATGAVYVRPSQTLVKSWTLSSAGCNADPSSCAVLKDTSIAFNLDLSANNQALHAVSCVTTPVPVDSYSDLYFGITTANRQVNVLTGASSNLAFRRLTVTNLLSQ